MGTFSMVDRVPEGRKPVSSYNSAGSTIKQTRRKIPSSKRGWLTGDTRRSVTWITPTHLAPVSHQHPLSWYSQ